VHGIGSERARTLGVNRLWQFLWTCHCAKLLTATCFTKILLQFKCQSLLIDMSTVFPTNGAFFCTHGKLYFVWHRTCGTEFEWCWENIVCFHHLNQHQIISSSFCRWSLMSALPRQPCGCLYRLYIKQKTCITTQNRHFRPSHFWYNSARVCSTQDGPDEQSSGSRAFCNHFLYGE